MGLNWKRVRDQKVIQDHGVEYFDIAKGYYTIQSGTKSEKGTIEPLSQKALDIKESFAKVELEKLKIEREERKKNAIVKYKKLMRPLLELIDTETVMNRCIKISNEEKYRKEAMVEKCKQLNVDYSSFLNKNSESKRFYNFLKGIRLGGAEMLFDVLQKLIESNNKIPLTHRQLKNLLGNPPKYLNLY